MSQPMGRILPIRQYLDVYITMYACLLMDPRPDIALPQTHPNAAAEKLCGVLEVSYKKNYPNANPAVLDSHSV